MCTLRRHGSSTEKLQHIQTLIISWCSMVRHAPSLKALVGISRDLGIFSLGMMNVCEASKAGQTVLEILDGQQRLVTLPHSCCHPKETLGLRRKQGDFLCKRVMCLNKFAAC